MRTRKEIEDDMVRATNDENAQIDLFMEVFLDIRDLLTKDN